MHGIWDRMNRDPELFSGELRFPSSQIFTEPAEDGADSGWLSEDEVILEEGSVVVRFEAA